MTFLAEVRTVYGLGQFYLYTIFILGSTSYFESFIITGSCKSIVVQQWSQKVRTNNKFMIEILLGWGLYVPRELVDTLRLAATMNIHED